MSFYFKNIIKSRFHFITQIHKAKIRKVRLFLFSLTFLHIYNLSFKTLVNWKVPLFGLSSKFSVTFLKFLEIK